MSHIDKQWLQQKIADMEAARDEIPFGLDDDDSNTLAALRIALASLEAEKSILYRERNPYNGLTTGWQELTDDEYEFIRDNAGENAEFRTVYSAPPVPANAEPEPVAWLWSHRKHPSEVTLVRPEDDEKAEAALWSGWSCQALCLVPPELVSQETADREMLKRLAVILSGSDAPGEIRSLTVTARSFVERCKILAKERDECRISMLQGTDGNSPVIPGGWVLVPVELTGTMTNAMTDAILDDLHNVDVWRSVLAAAPQQEAKP